MKINFAAQFFLITMKFSMVALDLTTSLKIVLKFQNCQCMHCLAFIFSATLYAVFYSHPFEIFVGFFWQYCHPGYLHFVSCLSTYCL